MTTITLEMHANGQAWLDEGGKPLLSNNAVLGRVNCNCIEIQVRIDDRRFSGCLEAELTFKQVKRLHSFLGHILDVGPLCL